MMTSSLLNNVNNNLQKLDEYSNQVASSIKVDKASDDPVAAAKILKAKSELNSQEQYSTNMTYASSYMGTVSDALTGVYDALESARTDAVSGSGSATTTSTSSLQALGDNVNSLLEEIVQVGNTDHNGSYVFAGGETSTAPFTATRDANGNITAVQFISSSYDTDSLDKTYSQNIEIASGVTLDLAAGKTTFHTDSGGSTSLNAVFSTLIGLRDSLNNTTGTTSASSQISPYITKIDGLLSNVTSEQAVVGAKSNRVESAQSRSTTYTDSLNALISGWQDADYAEASTEYSSQQATYEAALSVGAKIIQPSLLDYLK
jgi:flagellar hook-associated protein 3 FlgL